MAPVAAALIGSVVKIIADRMSKENLKHPTTIAAAASATSAVATTEVLPPDSPEALITQAVMSVLALVLFFWPPKKAQDHG